LVVHIFIFLQLYTVVHVPLTTNVDYFFSTLATLLLLRSLRLPRLHIHSFHLHACARARVLSAGLFNIPKADYPLLDELLPLLDPLQQHKTPAVATLATDTRIAIATRHQRWTTGPATAATAAGAPNTGGWLGVHVLRCAGKRGRSHAGSQISSSVATTLGILMPLVAVGAPVALALPFCPPCRRAGTVDRDSKMAAIVHDLQDKLLPVRAHALMELGQLVEAKVNSAAHSPCGITIACSHSNASI